MIDKYRELCNERFGMIHFDEPTHTYHVNGEIWPSVSKVVSRYFPGFNTDYWAGRKAKELGKDPEEIKREWKMKADISREFGSYVHEQLEIYSSIKYLNNKPIKKLTLNMDLIDKKKASQYIYFGQQWLDNKIASGYTLFDTELMMCNHKKKVCGTADLVFYRDGKFDIDDWKTNSKELDAPNYNRYLKPPFDYLPDNYLGHYTLNMNAYKNMLKEIAPVNNMTLVHLTERGAITYSLYPYWF